MRYTPIYSNHAPPPPPQSCTPTTYRRMGQKKTMRDERLNPSHPIRHLRRLVPVGGVDRVYDLTGCLDSINNLSPMHSPNPANHGSDFVPRERENRMMMQDDILLPVAYDTIRSLIWKPIKSMFPMFLIQALSFPAQLSIYSFLHLIN